MNMLDILMKGTATETLGFWPEGWCGWLYSVVKQGSACSSQDVLFGTDVKRSPDGTILPCSSDQEAPEERMGKGKTHTHTYRYIHTDTQTHR